MKTFVLRLVVTLIVLYGLGAVAYGLLHYPSGERPDVAGVLGDFTRDVGSVFRRSGSTPPAPAAPASSGEPTIDSGPRVTLDGLRGDSHLSLTLALIEIPNVDRLPAASARLWGPLQSIHATVLPQAIDELRRLRGTASTDKSADKPAFERDRAAVRARLATARTTLLPNTTGKAPMDAAVKMLDLLDQIDAKLAAL